MRGLFVTLEGIDRSGKSTQARLLAERLGDRAVAIREPGGTPAGERIRDLLTDPDADLSTHAEALLFAAARAQLVADVIRPALEQGRVVICDRYLDSSLAYQGAARGLGVAQVEQVNAFATGGLTPDLTLLLDIDPRVAAERAGELDRFELEGGGLQALVHAAYDGLAAGDPDRWRRIDAARPLDQVQADVIAAVGGAVDEAGAG